MGLRVSIDLIMLLNSIMHANYPNYVVMRGCRYLHKYQLKTKRSPDRDWYNWRDFLKSYQLRVPGSSRVFQLPIRPAPKVWSRMRLPIKSLTIWKLSAMWLFFCDLISHVSATALHTGCLTLAISINRICGLILSPVIAITVTPIKPIIKSSAER